MQKREREREQEQEPEREPVQESEPEHQRERERERYYTDVRFDANFTNVRLKNGVIEKEGDET